jgi:hypothetical protein
MDSNNNLNNSALNEYIDQNNYSPSNNMSGTGTGVGIGMGLGNNINITTNANSNNRYKGVAYNMEDNYLISPKTDPNFEKIQELIENQSMNHLYNYILGIINTLRSIKSNHSVNYEEIKALPTLFLEMQEALKKSNANVLELKETINEKIFLEKKLKIKLKEAEKEKELLRENMGRCISNENELKNKIEQMKIENLTLNQNATFGGEIQKKYEDLLKENKLLRRNNEDTDRKKEKLDEEIETKDKKLE